MNEPAFYQAALALGAGMTAQALAVRLGVPSIVVLLAAGVALGPNGLRILDPSVFGSARADLVALAVTVILFEGGLALDLARLRQQRRSLLLLLTLGAAISMAGGALAARFFLGLPWPVATLYGALVIVTGPTVVTPLLSRLTVDRPVQELLVSEGVLIDPIGAIVAIVVAEYVIGHHAVLESGWLVVARLGTGALAGVAGGLVLAFVLRRGWLSEDLANPAVLAGVLVVAACMSRISVEVGLIAAATQGIVLANAGLRGLRRLREFKEALTVILLSFIFVVLAADLRLSAVARLGWPALGVIAVLVWVARPLAVAAATLGSTLTLRQRAFVAWICPRGIVAAAGAGFFRILFSEAGVPGAAELEALVFVTVAVTVTVQGLTARPVARLLGVDVPSVKGTVLVGADHLGRMLARLLAALDRQVVVIDRNPRLCRAARAEGLSVYQGDALSVDALEDAGARYADTVVALTRNPELNLLVGQRVHDNFRVEHILAVAADAAERSTGARRSPFPGNFPGVDSVNRLLGAGDLEVIHYEAGATAAGHRLDELPYGEGEFALVRERGSSVLIATAGQALAPGDRLWCARPAGKASPLASILSPASPTGAP